MYRTLLILLFFNISSHQPVSAQSLDYGVEAGANGTIVAVSSSYTLSGDAIAKNPYIGYYGGGYAIYRYSTSSSIKARLLYEKRAIGNADGAPFTNDQGSFLGNIEGAKIRNYYLNLGLFYQYGLSRKLDIGIGVNTHILLSASTHFPGSNGFMEPYGTYPNHYYKTLNFSIPMQATLHLQCIDLFLTFDKGLFNRIKDGRSEVKEIENTLQLGLGYQLNK